MIEYRLDGNTARLRINNPDNGNRFTYRIMLDFIQAIEKAAQSNASVLLLDAAGPDFTLGRDQKEALPDVSRRENLGLILKANAALRHFPGVSVSLIQGRALGFGSGLALHSTISLAADNAIFGFDEIKHQLAPLVVVAYLPYFISPRIADELVLTGRPVQAEEAARIGLVTRIVPAQSLAEQGELLATQLGDSHPSALRLIRRFALEHGATAGYPAPDVSAQAVEQLVQWLEAGRP